MKLLKTIGILILIMGCIVGGYYTYQHFTTPKLSQIDEEILTTAKEAAKVDAAITRSIVDKVGFKHAVIQGTNNFLNTAQFLALRDSLLEKDRIIEILKREKGQLESYVKVLTTVTRPNTAIPYQSTTNDYVLEDKNLKLRISAPDSTGQVFLKEYKYNVDWNYLNYSKINWFKRRYYTDIWLGDTNATIEGVKRFTIKQAENKWGFRLSALGTYNPLIGDSWGGKATIKLKRSHLTGAYLYNTDQKTWYPSFGFEFNFLDF